MDRPEFVLFRDTWRVRVTTAMNMRGSIKWRISVAVELRIDSLQTLLHGISYHPDLSLLSEYECEYHISQKWLLVHRETVYGEIWVSNESRRPVQAAFANTASRAV